MTTISYLGDRYSINVLPVLGNQTRSGFIQFLWTHRRRSERSAACMEFLIKDLPKGISVVEHFGGAGLIGVVIEKILQPSSHKLFDVDEDCINQLKHTFGDENAAYGDAKEIMGTIYADLILMDIPWFNEFHAHEWPNLPKVFELKPQFVEISDTANQRLGIHREILSKRLNYPIVNNEDYITAMSHKFYKKYGYSVRKCGYHQFSFMLLTEGGPTEIEFLRVRS
jgi:hypothetical protein